MSRLDKIPNGAVKILECYGKWWIGYYDNITYVKGKTCACVYRGYIDMESGYFIIPEDEIEEISIQDLYERREIISKELFKENAMKKINYKKKCNLLVEYNYIQEVLMNIHVNARYLSTTNSRKIFISHSSKDKEFVRIIATELGNKGYDVWFDEWNIDVGESIPHEIAKGLKECDYLILVLSKNAVASNWVENEWHSIFWEEIGSNRIKLLPLLKEECDIPIMLRQKKYADFRFNYSQGLTNLIKAIK